MSKKPRVDAVTIYAVIAIFTFGHSAAHSAEKFAGIRALGGVIAGAAWPLYWSWEMWS